MDIQFTPGVDYPDVLLDVFTWLEMEAGDAKERGEDTTRYDECVRWLQTAILEHCAGRLGNAVIRAMKGEWDAEMDA